jgi:NAD(P)-dependent dehydrogenase (short-subunit alcohol dehydrogenase family)
MTMQLAGQVALVTGGSRGLGRAIAGQLAAAGAAGCLFDIAAGDAEPPAHWFAITGDVSREDELASAMAAIDERYGRLDIVVANAGVVPPWRETEHIDLDEWQQVFAVNVGGVMATIKQAVPLMKAHGGSIIAMASLNAHQAHPRQCLYTATKHAVLGIVRATALDLGRYAIRVNALGPGPIATDALLGRLQHRATCGEPEPHKVLQQFAEAAALRRMATEDDVARAALFLASDAAGGITGQLLPVDAGLP